MKNLYLILLAGIFACNTATTPSETSQAPFPRIDVHTHYNYDRDSLPALLSQWNMRTILILVALGDSVKDQQRWDAMVAHQQAHPETFFLCSGFDGTGIDAPDYAAKKIAMIKSHIAAGARMVKVWKNFGMVTKDAAGKFIQIDDPRLQPIWDYLTENNIPVIAHIGEPLQAWRELEPGNPHYNYFRDHPQYHAFHHPEIPRYEEIIQARDNWVERNPNLTIIGAHMGSMSHDVDMVAERLDRFPNFYVETAARVGDLTRQDFEKMHNFMIRYQDRVLYGTDLGTSEPQSTLSQESLQSEQSYLGKILELDWAYFGGKDSMNYNSPMISFPVKTKALELPDSVVQKFYYKNAARILRIENGM
ncbi:MAG: amidohydrolase family protein [Bacteroidia bacterium]